MSSVLASSALCLTLALSGSQICLGQIDVVYTGRLLGYMRFPDRQSPSMSSCESDTATMNEPSRALYKALRDRKGSSAVQVGVGDNFSPDLFARTFDGAPPDAPPFRKIPHPAKEMFTWDDQAQKWISDASVTGSLEQKLLNGNAVIPADNVGCFLRAAGYDAIVPGKHDFYFGPERLRMMAKFLYSDQGSLPKTALLAANLAITSTEPDAKPRLPLYQVQDSFRSENNLRKQHQPPLPTFGVLFLPQADDQPPRIDLPTAVLPWLREIKVSNAFILTRNGSPLNLADLPPRTNFGNLRLRTPRSILHSTEVLVTLPGGTPEHAHVALTIDALKLCRNATHDPYAFDRPGPDTCIDVPEKQDGQIAGDDFLSTTITFALQKEELKPNSNWAACVHLTNPHKNEPNYLCQTFAVAQPFFSYDRAGNGEPDDPFVVKTLGNKTTVAVFGLVDPDLQDQVGRLNDGWLNRNSRYDTSIQVMDLKESLSQAMQRCKLNSLCVNSTYKVLLAEMPAFKATQFLTSIDDPVFDLAVAQTDSAHRTGDQDITLKNIPAKGGANFVVTPDELYKAGDPTKVSPKVQKATVERPVRTSAGNWKLTNIVIETCNPSPCTLPSEQPSSPASPLKSLAISALTALGVEGIDPTTWSAEQVLQRLALTVMQRDYRADVSLLQTRDLFESRFYGAAPVTKDNLQEMLDRVFWKGDYAVRVEVTGTTLTSLMVTSATFHALDANPLNTDLEKGRSLASLGIFQEPANQNWMVNGAVVDPAKLYSLSLSDFLALGDTGYTALQTPPVLPAYRMKDFKKLDSISGMVCRTIRDSALPGAQCFGDAVKPADHLDASNQLPADTTPGLTSWRQFLAYVSPRLKYHKFLDLYEGQNAAEKKAHEKAFWSFEIEKGDLGLNVYRHNKYSSNQTQSLNNQFAGVQIATVTAPNSSLVTYDNRSRLKRSSAMFDFYLMDDSSLAFSRIQETTDDNYTKNLALNSAAIESGVLHHLSPSYRQPTQLDLLAAFRYETQPLSPRQDIILNGNPKLPSPTQPGVIRSTIERSHNLFAKLGFRATDDHSWIEFGGLAGRQLRVPYELIFNNSSPGNNFAFLEPGQCATCSADLTTGLYSRPAADDHRYLDWINYLDSNDFINKNTRFHALYESRPQLGMFLNFSLNFPLPVGNHYANLTGKQIAFLMENNGQLFFNEHADLAAETRYFDKLTNSLVVPLLGNLSFKPEVDFIWYRNKVANLPFHAVQYQGSLSYTFSWRQGQRFLRAYRYPSPTPATTTPSAGR